MGTHITKDRKSTRLNSSHTEIYTLSLHDALPIYLSSRSGWFAAFRHDRPEGSATYVRVRLLNGYTYNKRSEEHTSELQSHRDLHSFPTRRSSDLPQLPVGVVRRIPA